jgi:hypothetical protein
MDRRCAGVRARCVFNGLVIGVVFPASLAAILTPRGGILALGVSSPSTRLGEGLAGASAPGQAMFLFGEACRMDFGVVMMRVRVLVGEMGWKGKNRRKRC